MQTSQFARTILLAMGLAGLAACGNKSGAQPDEPFGFTEVRKLAVPIGTMTPTTARATRARLRSNASLVVKSYRDAFTRFDAIYGDGFGPVRRWPEYLGCKRAFHAVAVRIGAVDMGLPQTDLKPLWASLEQCRTVARDWSGPAEIATFANDLAAMADGAMLVLSYAATVQGGASGPAFYRRLELLDVTSDHPSA